jgi:hypothetical protein
MSYQYWLIEIDDLTLLLETVIWVQVIYYPHIVECIFSSERSFLFPSDSRMAAGTEWLRCQIEHLPEQVRVSSDLDSLTVADELITAEEVS